MKNLLPLFIIWLVSLIPFNTFSQSLNMIDNSGKKQGKWIKRDDNGFISYIGHFKDDLPQGMFRYYYPYKDTIIKSILIHSMDGKTAWVKNFHMNKKLMSMGKYINKQKDSTWTFYHEAGYKTLEENYKNGRLHGKSMVYYDDGKILSEKKYTDGKKDGEFKDYFDNGNIKFILKYVSDEPEGRFVQYYPDGKINIEGFYLKGSQHKTWTVFNSNGSIQKKEIYDRGTLLNGKQADEFLKKNTQKSNSYKKTDKQSLKPTEPKK